MDAVQLINQAPLKAIFFGHFVLITLSMLAEWLPTSYFFYNAIFLISLMWSIHHKDSHEPVFISMMVNLSAILFDIFEIGIYWGINHYRAWFGFSVFMTIANLLLRPLSTILLYRIYNERQGRYSSFGFPGFGDFGGSRPANPTQPGRGSYENIDSNIPHQSVPSPIHGHNDAESNYPPNSIPTKPPAYPDFS